MSNLRGVKRRPYKPDIGAQPGEQPRGTVRFQLQTSLLFSALSDALTLFSCDASGMTESATTFGFLQSISSLALI
jgi:hypothetical protein